MDHLDKNVRTNANFLSPFSQDSTHTIKVATNWSYLLGPGLQRSEHAANYLGVDPFVIQLRGPGSQEAPILEDPESPVERRVQLSLSAGDQRSSVSPFVAVARSSIL